MNPTDLERLVDRELARLAAPRAPLTLLPRVLEAVRAWSARPWHARAWRTWPVGWQVASVAALLLLVAAGAETLPIVRAATASAVSAPVSGVWSDLAAGIDRATGAATAARVLWRALVQPLVPFAFAVVVLMSMACGVLGTALNRVVLGRAVQ